MLRFDVPLIAFGNRARGVIAIGNIATGVIAIGNVARGVIAFGNVAIGGVFAAGNVAVGLVAAGNVAIAPLFALGASLGMGGLYGYAGALGMAARSGHEVLNWFGFAISRPFAGAQGLSLPIAIVLAPIAWLIAARLTARDAGFGAWLRSIAAWIGARRVPPLLPIDEAPVGEVRAKVLGVSRHGEQSFVQLALEDVVGTAKSLGAVRVRVDSAPVAVGDRVCVILTRERRLDEGGYRDAHTTDDELVGVGLRMIDDRSPNVELGQVIAAGYRTMILVTAVLTPIALLWWLDRW